MKRTTVGFTVAAAALASFLILPSSAEAGKIKKRAENQQDRIAQGVKSGELTAGETARVEKKEARLNHEVRDMREDNGGKLTDAEKAKVNHQQNRLSKDIYKQKHDSQPQPN